MKKSVEKYYKLILNKWKLNISQIINFRAKLQASQQQSTLKKYSVQMKIRFVLKENYHY